MAISNRSEVNQFNFTGRSSGILLHLTSLPGKHGSGDLGPDAYKFVELSGKGRSVMVADASCWASGKCSGIFTL